jgi:hypothetical protein
VSARHYVARPLTEIDGWDARRLAPVDEARVITALAKHRATQASKPASRARQTRVRTLHDAADAGLL